MGLKMKKAIGCILISMVASAANAWYPPDPEIRKFYAYMANAKPGTTIDCEGTWDKRDKIGFAPVKCETPKAPTKARSAVALNDLTLNGWEILSRDLLPHAPSYAPEGIPGFHHVVVRAKKIEIVKEYAHHERGPMTRPQ